MGDLRAGIGSRPQPLLQQHLQAGNASFMSVCPAASNSGAPHSTGTLQWLAIWGYATKPSDQAQIAELITGIGGIIGSVPAIHGSVVATQKIP